IAAGIIIAFGGLVTSPAVAATRIELERQERIAPHEQTASAKLNETLLAVKAQLRTLAGKPDKGPGIAAASAPDVEVRTAAREALKDLRKQLKALDKAAREDFREIEQHIKKNNLSDVILQRHYDAVATYETEADALLASLADIETAAAEKVQERAAKAFERLEKHQLKPSHKPFDPDKMPFGRPDDNVRKPALSTEEFSAIGIESKPEVLAASIATVATAGFGVDDPTNPLYLAATPDAQITPAIQRLAEDLDHNPVEIHNWVRNNIEFMPTYGSIQGSQLTLDNRKGNAFDIASLTIALLRASGIPARYVYGTIEIPVDKVMNWVGGVTSPMAAGNLLGQGGIPHTAMASAGEIKAFRLEHVWVEAWVDFYPSYGAVNHQGDTWVPMDASFKQYEYTDGVDMQQAVPFDANGFTQDVMASATINEAEGWVRGVDQSLIQARMEKYRADVEAFINAQDPDTTVGDVIGTKIIIEQNLPILAGVLSSKVVAIGARYGELPGSLRLEFRYQLQNQYGSTLATFEVSTVDLAGKRLALSFRPTTQADADLIASYLPEPPADGSDVDPGDLPDSLPGYLINLTAEFTVNGEVVASGPTVAMGTELKGMQGYHFPGQGWNLRPAGIVAGEYQAIGLDLAGIAQSQLEQLKTDLEAAKAQLEANNPEGLTRHGLTGNLLQTGVLSYFALNDVQDQMAAKSAGVVTNRLPSFGSFSTTVQTSYWYGMPREVTFPGVTMDISFMFTQVADKTNVLSDATTFLRTVGPRTSALEHLVPEQLLSTTDNPANGISAVKAIALAQTEGQRVYSITAENLDAALVAVNADSAIENEIRNAVSADKEVRIHKNPISYYGWQGYGYIIVDPETGSGAYKISGGLNGGETIFEGLQAYFSLLIDSQAQLKYLAPLFKQLLKFFIKVFPWLSGLLTLLEAFQKCSFGDFALIAVSYVLFTVAIAIVFAPIPGALPMLAIFFANIASFVIAELVDKMIDTQCR
ncbi:MAG TPA: transglutaminase domain-containing protein, partial [Gammaproteobacteria bacterium]